jgi:3-oxoacyl-[acyl-carrier-protein] synthase II
MAVAIIARGAVSALGSGSRAFDVGGPGEPAPGAWSTRHGDRPFARATVCSAERSVRPAALFELALRQLVDELSATLPEWRAKSLGVVVGTSSGGLAALEQALAVGPRDTDDSWRHSAYFAPLEPLALLLGRPPERLVSLYGACASSALAMGLGMRWLELNRCQLVIAGGYDAESDWVGAGFDSLKATSSAPPRSFRRDRSGMALGEGAALVALERPAPGQRSYGFIAGFGATSDAVHITAPDRSGSGLARALRLALGDAGLVDTDVNHVSVHGTGTSFNDASEAAALRSVFGDQAEALWLHAFKPSLGHTLGAASALESLAVLAAMQRGIWPASAGAGEALPELPARLLERNEPALVERCLKLATAFGGANAALLLSRVAPPARERAGRTVYLVAAGAPCHELELEAIALQLVAAPERLPRSDMLSSLAIAASAEALRAAGAAGLEFERQRTGVIVGSVGATLEADADFGARIIARGLSHAEPRRFPATSPNACAGHVSIAFGLGGPAHAVGAGQGAVLEALLVARDWIAAGDAEAMLVVAAEQVGQTSRRALASFGIDGLEQGAQAVLLAAASAGPALDEALIERATAAGLHPENPGFRGLEALREVAGLPGSVAFGSVRPPE